MREQSESFESQLLDRHLGRLEDDQRETFESKLADSPEFAARDRGLGALLDLLDAHEAPDPPDDLADKVLARVEEQTAILPFREPASAVPAGTAQEVSATPVLSLRELIAIAACITLFVGVFVPGYYKAQNVARQNLCRKHMAQLGQAMAAYAQDNNQCLTWAGYKPGGSWLPTRTPNVQRYSNTRPYFLLLKHNYIPDQDPRVFTCPAVPHSRPMIADNYDEFSDFPERANVTISPQFMNRPQPLRMTGVHRKMVLAADANPLFSPHVTRQINPYEDKGNSLAHGGGRGQNAIFVDGSAGWFTEPTIGIENDNIYRLGELVHYEGTEEPASEEDSFLP